MSRTRYIRFENAGFIIWPERGSYLSHADMAAKIGEEPLSAGFCGTDGRKWTCYGKSISLNLDSHESDSARLTEYMNGY